MLQARPVTVTAAKPKSAAAPALGDRPGDGHVRRRRGRRAIVSSGPDASELVEIVDTTTRDGNQSLWSATGLTTPDVLAIAPAMDRVGFHALDFTSSTHMAVSVRFHREDPWERIRLVSAGDARDTPLNFITTGMRFISWVPAGEDVIRLAFRLRRPQRDPALSDRRALQRPRRADPACADGARGGRRGGGGRAHLLDQPGAHARLLRRARASGGELGGHRSPLPQGPGRPADHRRRARAGRRGSIDAFAPRPVELHSHCTIGLGPLAYVEGLRAGIRTLHTAVAPLANGTSNPSGEMTLAQPRGRGLRRIASISRRWPRSRRTSASSPREKDLPLGAPAEYDAAYYRHQMPGGMVTTTQRQLDEIGRPELFDATLEEVTRVRAEMGYPIMVTPVSQFVATQAVMNVISKERWSKVSNEIVALLPRPLLRARRAGRPGGRGASPRRCRAPRSCASWSRSASTPPASASAQRSPTRSCCCG